MVTSRGHVLSLLRDAGPLSRIELSRRSELSPTTMTRVVAQMLDDGCVAEVEGGGDAGRLGRPPTEVALVPDAFTVCGIQLGAGFARIGLCDLLARPTHETGFEFSTSQPPEQVLTELGRRVNALMDGAGVGRRRLLGIGVAVPGPVDAGQRRNLLSIILGWRDVDVADALEDAVGKPTVVDPNVRAMAVAETRFGLGRAANSLAYVYVRTGVGAGLVFNGEPFRGGTHGDVQLGHLRVVEKGRRCACGAYGCLETVASERHLLEQLSALGDGELESPLAAARDSGRDLLSALEAAAASGFRPAAQILDEFTEHLTTGLTSVVNLLNPELILLGGIFAEAPEVTFDRVRARLRAEVFPLLRDAVRVERSGLGLDAGVIGAAAVALDRFFYC